MNHRNEISEVVFDKIERYLCNDMASEEREEFREMIRHDPELKVQVDELKILMEGIEAQSLKEKMDDFHQSIADVTTDVRPYRSKTVLFSYKTLALAASIIVLLGIGGYWIIYHNSPAALYNTYFSPDPGLPTVMGSSDNFEFYDAMVNYKYGDYSMALGKWEEQLEVKPNNDTLNYFVGVAKMALNDTKSAIPNLEMVVQQPSSPFYNEALFYLGLAYLKNEDMDNALKQLRESKLKASQDLIGELEK